MKSTGLAKYNQRVTSLSRFQVAGKSVKALLTKDKEELKLGKNLTNVCLNQGKNQNWTS